MAASALWSHSFRIALLAALLGGLSLTLAARESRAAYPGANGKIAFDSDRDGGDREIYVMNADGSGQTRLTNSPGVDFDPAWSPDGQKIAFVSGRDGNFEIYVMNADGSAQTRVTNNNYSDRTPAWSPDGRRIAFTRDETGLGDIWAMNADGGNETWLTNPLLPNNECYDGGPDWSPDAKQIAYYSRRNEVPCSSPTLYVPDIYTIKAWGGGDTLLTGSSPRGSYPSYSPDGQKIAFHGFPGPSYSAYDIYSMNANGSGTTVLTESPADDQYPSWSPDGQKIAFESLRDGNKEIYAMNANGSAETRLTNNGATNEFPHWQPVTADSDGDGLTNALENGVFHTDPQVADTDRDGCPDGSEIESNNERFGGRRDPLNPYDYFNAGQDGLNTVADILAVVAHFGAKDTDTATSPHGAAVGDRHSPIPAAITGPPFPYSANYDRAGLPGQNAWNLDQGDGNITIAEVLMQVKQFGHNCHL